MGPNPQVRRLAWERSTPAVAVTAFHHVNADHRAGLKQQSSWHGWRGKRGGGTSGRNTSRDTRSIYLTPTKHRVHESSQGYNVRVYWLGWCQRDRCDCCPRQQSPHGELCRGIVPMPTRAIADRAHPRDHRRVGSVSAGLIPGRERVWCAMMTW